MLWVSSQVVVAKRISKPKVSIAINYLYLDVWISSQVVVAQRISKPKVSIAINYLYLDVWVAVSNHLEGPETDLTVPGANFLTGIHGYRKQDGGGIVFLATDVGKNGAALFKIEDENITKLYEGIKPAQHCIMTFFQSTNIIFFYFPDSSATYFESVVYSPKSRSIYLTSPSTHSIIR